MLDFFPSAFPDETLFSRLARYHRLSGHPDDRTSLRELVGLHTHVITSDLPSLLQTLVSRIPQGVSYSAEEIIRTGTVFPYFQVFLPTSRSTRVVESMSSGSSSGLKMTLGLVASRVGGKNLFRFCKSCMDADRLAFGQAYWHRVHQLPGVWACPLHSEAVFELSTIAAQLKRHKLFLPDDPFVEENSSQLCLSVNQFASILRISRLSQAVLNGELLGSTSWSFSEVHRTNAGRKDLIRSNGRVRVAELAAVLERYSSNFPSYGEYTVLHNRFLDCALKLLRKPRGNALHPLKHILLIDCLGDERPAGSRCSPTSPTLGVTGNRRKRRRPDENQLVEMLGERKCSMTHTAAALGLSKTTVGVEAARLGLLVNRRPKKLTDELRSNVSTSLRNGLTPQEVADRHGLSQVSVYRILRMDAALATEYLDRRFQARRDAYRTRYASQTSSRSDYAWLRRNDKEWLAEQQALAPKPDVKRQPYVDWTARDKMLAQQVVESSAAMRRMAGKPRRASRAALEREIGMADTIEQNAEKLPMTHAALSAYAESREEYQGRRLRWAAAELKKQLAGPPPRWRLLREAGIRILAQVNEKLLSSLASS